MYQFFVLKLIKIYNNLFFHESIYFIYLLHCLFLPYCKIYCIYLYLNELQLNKLHLFKKLEFLWVVFKGEYHFFESIKNINLYYGK